MIIYKVKDVPCKDVFLYANDALKDEFLTFFSSRTVDINSITEFYKEYGHYIPEKITFGGKFVIYARSSIDKKTDKSQLKDDLAVTVGKVVNALGIGVKAGFAEGNEEKKKDNKVNKSFMVEKTVRGGTHSECYNDWLESLNDPIVWNVIGYEHLIETISFFP
jgi:hypothetical protein